MTSTNLKYRDGLKIPSPEDLKCLLNRWPSELKNLFHLMILTRQDAGSVASARCTFVNTNGSCPHSRWSFGVVVPRNSANLEFNKTLFI
jgi:hypothetical protein